MLTQTYAKLEEELNERKQAEKALARCTGEQLGDDPAAWRHWWAGKEAQATAARSSLVP